MHHLLFPRKIYVSFRMDADLYRSLILAVEADRQVRNMLEKSTFQRKGIKKTSKNKSPFNLRRHEKLHVGMGSQLLPPPPIFKSIQPIDMKLGMCNKCPVNVQLSIVTWHLIGFHGNHSNIMTSLVAHSTRDSQKSELVQLMMF